MTTPEDDTTGMSTRYLLAIAGQAHFKAAMWALLAVLCAMLAYYLVAAKYPAAALAFPAALFAAARASFHFSRARRLRALANTEQTNQYEN